ncbi:MAG: TM2 domain-containing protein [Bacteroidetes bacterium]|nr:TM2 domain-containing protein [Bacteroidota bacterium]
MKKVFTVFAFFVITSTFLFADGGKYKINDQAVDHMIASATEISMNDMSTLNIGMNSVPSEQVSEKNPWVAWILCATYFGHRIYLGSKTGTIILYVCTGGGCGIVTTVDAIVLLIGAINEDISKFIDNDKFIMWGK